MTNEPTQSDIDVLPPEKLPDQSAGTEALLDSLILECRRLVREVALPSMTSTADGLERMRFIDSAVSLVVAGAKVGDTVARLRSGSSGAETRHRVVVEHARPVEAGGGEGGAKT